jgi:hypothetical protein
LIVTAQQQLFQLPDGSRAILEAAALLDQPFSVPLLIDGFYRLDALNWDVRRVGETARFGCSSTVLA